MNTSHHFADPKEVTAPTAAVMHSAAECYPTDYTILISRTLR
jgi:hypothetical protein